MNATRKNRRDTGSSRKGPKSPGSPKSKKEVAGMYAEDTRTHQNDLTAKQMIASQRRASRMALMKRKRMGKTMKKALPTKSPETPESPKNRKEIAGMFGEDVWTHRNEAKEAMASQRRAARMGIMKRKRTRRLMQSKLPNKRENDDEFIDPGNLEYFTDDDNFNPAREKR